MVYSRSSLKLVVGTPSFTLDSSGMGIRVNIFCWRIRLAVRLRGLTMSSVFSVNVPWVVGRSWRGCLDS